MVSLVTVAGLRTPLSEPVPPPRRRLRAELVEGLAWLWHDRFLRTVSLWLAASGVAFTSLGLVTLVLARDLGARRGYSPVAGRDGW